MGKHQFRCSEAGRRGITSKVHGNHLRFIALLGVGFTGFLFFLDSLIFSVFDSPRLHHNLMTPPTSTKVNGMKYASSYSTILKSSWQLFGVYKFQDDQVTYDVERDNTSVVMYERLLNLASKALAEKEFKNQQPSLWEESYSQASTWKPCSHGTQATLEKAKESNGFILVSANGGLNQQRVAVCNAVAVASLLNATLIIPKFLYSNVWKDPSQFGDIYQEEYFIKTLKNEVKIVKEIPFHLRSMDLEAIGSVITDSDLVKEAKPSDYTRLVRPILLRNGIVHLLGFGNRLGFDPLPSKIQKLRCKCNFHALKFVPKIQKAGSLLVRRIRKNEHVRNTIDKQLMGSFIQDRESKEKLKNYHGPSKYVALHLRFEEDMVAYSLCDFGGGEAERRELQAYREAHFPLMLDRLNSSNIRVTASELRLSGRCPLTPEESALVLAGLGFNRGTYIYLAGSQIYDAKPRMKPFTSLYPNLVTKEDIFNSGSQFSSLVSGYRAYFGLGKAPIIRPNKKGLAAIMMENSTIEWDEFGDRMHKMVKLEQILDSNRGYGQSMYRHPTTPECMCRLTSIF
ncbi:hypothetical protein V2J09_011644 [Rumex salicifolius]